MDGKILVAAVSSKMAPSHVVERRANVSGLSGSGITSLVGCGMSCADGCEWAESNGKATERAALVGNGPTYV